jgi:putative phage-type endonuclease
MPITEKQKEQRQKYLGSSDAAAVAGIDPFRSPADVYYDKTGQIEITGNEPTGDAIEVGVSCEEAVLNWFAKKKGLTLVRNQRRVHDNKIMAASLDAMVKDDPTQLVEAKTTGVVSRFVNEQWGEVGTGEVPERIQLQCLHQMAVVPEARVVWVPVLMGGVGLRHYVVERNEEMIRDLTDLEVGFWKTYVEAHIPPPDVLPSMETLKRIRREPTKKIPVAEAVVQDWLSAKEALKAAEETKQTKERLLLQTLGDAEAGECALGVVTYFMGKPRAAYTVPAGPGYRTLRLMKP